ncbi:MULTISPECIES: hypothetical protein [Rhizobium]|uniref:Conserved protein n=1 Tax=Rhizobium favelukesii TaxID=348824 RepID=W6RBB1_9HYPH|nr:MULTISPECIES: hypothetical protein [Rhizobium]MCS0460326.1 hypothetical protein [Rhizobium favelukesii]UFS80869.1 hypothetical protein LPB79_21190 [Rhizobium sp. T136]CDM57610.1 putative conserved protein [Rhizobium favelukesii]
MNTKKPIDKIRDGAGQMDVGDEADGRITSATTINDRLYIIKERAVYVIAMADEIDPDRTNIGIPNTQQLVLSIGSDSEIIQRILLTAAELFKKDRLLPEIDWNAALVTALDIVKDLVAAQEIAESYNVAKLNAESKMQSAKGMSFRLPAIPDIQARTKDYIQKMDHAFQNVYRLCSIFYDEKDMRAAGAWLDGFVVNLQTRLAIDDPFIPFATALANFGKLVRNIRHCIEHPKSSQRLDLRDYHLTPNRELVAPSIAVVHPATPIDQTPLEEFFAVILSQSVDGIETLMAFLAASNVATLGKFQIMVGEVPEHQRRDGVRFGYLVGVGGGWNRLG